MIDLKYNETNMIDGGSAQSENATDGNKYGDDENNCFCDGITWGYHYPNRDECEQKCCDDWPPKTGYIWEGAHWDCP